MGYELKLYIVESLSKKPLCDSDKAPYAGIIAELDLCKTGDDAILALKDKVKKNAGGEYPVCGIYAEDGNNMVVEDCYGDKNHLIPIKEAYEAVKVSCAQGEPYRRTIAALALLTPFLDEKMWSPECTFVVLYGH